MLSSRQFTVTGTRARSIVDLGRRSIASARSTVRCGAAPFPGFAAGTSTRSREGSCSADEIRQQAARLFRCSAAGPLRIPRAGRSDRPALEHPASEERQRRLLHHLVQEGSQFPAKVRDVLQFGHLKIAKRSARAFSKIVHRRFTETCHSLSPEGWAGTILLQLHRRVTQRQYYATPIQSVVMAATAGPPGR